MESHLPDTLPIVKKIQKITCAGTTALQVSALTVMLIRQARQTGLAALLKLPAPCLTEVASLGLAGCFFLLSIRPGNIKKLI